MAELTLELAALAAIAAAPSTSTTTMSVDDEVGHEFSIRRPGAGDGALLDLSDPAGSLEVLVIGPTVFVRGDELPGGAEWVQMGLDDLLDTTGIDGAAVVDDPLSGRLQQLAGFGVGLQPIGIGRVADGTTAIYRFSADVTGLVDQAMASGLVDGSDAGATPLSRTATIEVHADVEGRVVQLAYDQTFAQDGRRRTVRVVERFSGFGDTEVLAPPAPEVTIGLEQLEQLDPAATPQRS